MREHWGYGTGRSIALVPGAFCKKLTFVKQYARDHPGADPYDLEILKDFVRMMAYGIDGIYGDPKVGEESVLVHRIHLPCRFRSRPLLPCKHSTQVGTSSQTRMKLIENASCRT